MLRHARMSSKCCRLVRVAAVQAVAWMVSSIVKMVALGLRIPLVPTIAVNANGFSCHASAHTKAVVGSCCREGGCDIALATTCAPNQFVLGEHTCLNDCGACATGDGGCNDDVAQPHCVGGTNAFTAGGSCSTLATGNEIEIFLKCFYNSQLFV
jgi:hypothetical protein